MTLENVQGAQMNFYAYHFVLSSSFLWGFAGSIAVEIISLNEWFETGEEVNSKYKSIGFWIARILLACVGGGLSYVYGIEENALLAANIGASAPAIIRSLRNNAV